MLILSLAIILRRSHRLTIKIECRLALVLTSLVRRRYRNKFVLICTILGYGVLFRSYSLKLPDLEIVLIILPTMFFLVNFGKQIDRFVHFLSVSSSFYTRSFHVTGCNSLIRRLIVLAVFVVCLIFKVLTW